MATWDEEKQNPQPGKRGCGGDIAIIIAVIVFGIFALMSPMAGVGDARNNINVGTGHIIEQYSETNSYNSTTIQQVAPTVTPTAITAPQVQSPGCTVINQGWEQKGLEHIIMRKDGYGKEHFYFVNREGNETEIVGNYDTSGCQ